MKNAILLWGLALLVAVAPIAALSLSSCQSARDHASAGIGALVDCEGPNLKAATAELVPVFKLAILKLVGVSGAVDTEKLRAACAALLGDLPRCAMVSAIAALTTTTPAGLTVIAQPLAVPDPGALRAAFESVRGDWGGASYRTAAGVI